MKTNRKLDSKAWRAYDIIRVFVKGELPTNGSDSVYTRKLIVKNLLKREDAPGIKGAVTKSRHVRCLLTVDTIGLKPKGDQ